MATVSPVQPVATLTPPSSSHGGRGSWDFAVPLDGENTTVNDQKPYTSDDATSKHSYSRQPLSTQTNGTGRSYPQRNDTQDSHRSAKDHTAEPGYLKPNRLNQLGRKNSDLSANSESDSLLDLYKTTPTESRTPSNGYVPGGKRKMSLGTGTDPQEADDNNWIHRDKLAQIEWKELEEAGFRVRRMSRTGSRSNSSSRNRHRRPDPDQDVDGTNGDERANGRYPRDEKRQRQFSPIPAEEEDENEDKSGWDLRTPAEIAAAEREKETHPARNHSVRPSTSRIPLSKTSPVPIPDTYVQRDSPLPRSRNGSGAWSGNYGEGGIPPPRTRVRSGSVASQVMLDDSEDASVHTPKNQVERERADTNSTTSPQSSPPKSKVPNKNAPTSGARKTGRVTSNARRGPSSTTSPPARRPGTSSGSSRPSTASRPEGEAPWIATMYKPDPRLPPDQQMLPTHAKRLAQEQWEKEGKTGSVYDRDFRLLNTDDFPRPERLSKDSNAPVEEERKKEEEKPAWPLQASPPLASPTFSQTSSQRPGTSGTDHGGYSTIPKISSPPMPQGRSTTPRPQAVTTPKPEPVRMQEPPEVKEKKACCCIVM